MKPTIELRSLFASSRYMLATVLLVAFIGTLARGGWPIWVALGLSILLGGCIDESLGDDRERLGSRAQHLFDASLYATLPLLMIITCLLLCLVSSCAGDSLFVQPLPGAPASRPASGVIGAVIGAGYFYALAGVTAAHELTHRITSPLALLSARILFAFTINPTHETYHVHGHHRNVGKYDDPSTARRGEYVLAFIVRSVVHQSTEGWRLEAERLRRRKLGAFSGHNRVLGGIFCSLVILLVAAVIAGTAGMIAFVAAALVGRVLHEMVSYVQHYGVIRADGAPIEARHSWDCYRVLSNALQYNLPRHADHHMFASKPFWELDASAGSPKLPHGYQTMAMIALFPPLWHRAIDPLLADWDSRLANDAERAIARERGWTVDARMPVQADRALVTVAA